MFKTVTIAPNAKVARALASAIKDRFDLPDHMVTIDANLGVRVDCGTSQDYIMQLMLFTNGFMRGLIFATEQQRNQ